MTDVLAGIPSLIEPRDTFVFRDGRQLHEAASPMRSLDLPWPSTTTGMVRTRLGQAGNDGVFPHGDQTVISEVLREQVAGPFVAQLDERGTVIDWLFPTPQDAVWMKSANDVVTRYRLAPVTDPAGALSDLPPGLSAVGPVRTLPSGKAIRSPSYISLADLQQWLLAPQDVVVCDGASQQFEPLHERREHVALTESKASRDGHIFRTDSVRYRTAAYGQRHSIAIVAQTALADGPVFLGGERRVSTLRQASEAPPIALTAPPASARTLRVVLLTPACFRNGAVPTTLAGAPVVAACVARPQIISGWDFAARAPKHTRRLAPAGSVYWVAVPDRETARDVADRIMWKHVSDTPQDCLDGYGLAAVGVG